MQSTGREINVGVDIGSTTAKLVIRDGENVLYKKYERHYEVKIPPSMREVD